MKRRLTACWVICLSLSWLQAAEPQKDRGKERVGQIMATIYVGTDEGVERLGLGDGQAKPVEAAMVKRLQSVKKLRFKHYRQLGKDKQAVFRSYENWLSPLKPSEEILLSFESRGRTADGGLRLDLEFWQQRRKVMKSDPVLYKGSPLLILGPQWRGGHLIIAVELIQLEAKP